MADDRAAVAPAQLSQTATQLGPDVVRAAMAEALDPSRFLVSERLRLEWCPAMQEECAWELFHGRLLDASQTRQRQVFESQSVFQIEESGRSAEPVLSIKWEVQCGQLHVVRGILCYAWEAFDAADNVIESRETRKWIRELVGTVDLSALSSKDHLRATLARVVFQAVVGTSRLPLTSLEAPLPAFTLGDLAYRKGDIHLFRDGKSCTSPVHALTADQSWQEKAKLAEAMLRFTPAEGLPAVVELFTAAWKQLGQTPAEITVLLRTVFNEVALSPYTDFVDKALAFLRLLEEGGHLTTEMHADFLSFVLRHLVRHLTAYDLVTFHHRGANYPDALLIDAALRAYLVLAEKHPDLFVPSATDSAEIGQRKRIRRRALRLGFLLRRQYDGHAVPDAPTSPGENVRVLPAPFARLPEEQILDPTHRSRRLFAAEPLALGELGQVLSSQSAIDLSHPAELLELGTALFLDRPLGIGKRSGEPDRTPLLSYVAFSRSVAERRLGYLAEVLKLIDEATLQAYRARLQMDFTKVGLSIRPSRQPARPGVVSLDDAFRVAGDFVILKTTAQTSREFCVWYGLKDLFKRVGCVDLLEEDPLIIGGAFVTGLRPGTLAIYDGRFRLRIELEIDTPASFTNTVEGEFPGLSVCRAWSGDNRQIPLAVPIRLTAPCPATRQ
jgi:hypothetical protein